MGQIRGKREGFCDWEGTDKVVMDDGESRLRGQKLQGGIAVMTPPSGKSV